MTAKTITSAANEGLGKLLGMLSTGVFRLLVLIIMALVYFQGKTALNAFIDQNPTLVETKLAVSSAQVAVANAVATAAKSDDKINQLAVSNDRIFTSLRTLQVAADTTNTTVGIATATLTTEISGLGKRLDRIEAKQDAASR